MGDKERRKAKRAFGIDLGSAPANGVHPWERILEVYWAKVRPKIAPRRRSLDDGGGKLGLRRAKRAKRRLEKRSLNEKVGF